MNILYLCSEYPPYQNGGIGTATKIVAEELALRGHNVYVAGYYTELRRRAAEEVINGVKIFRYNLGFRRGKYRRKVVTVCNKAHIASIFIQLEVTWFENKIANLICQKDINLLEIPDYYGFNICHNKLRYRRFSVPTVLRTHGSISFLNHYASANDKITYNNDLSHFKRADWLCSVSQFSEKFIKEEFPSLEFKKACVIYNPIEESFFKHNEPADKKNILFVGKLKPTKGADVVLKAFDRLHTDNSDWHLSMVGGGDINKYSTLIPEVLKPFVHFLGFCDRKALMKEIDNCSFACIPSYFETFGLVPIEVMSRTRTVIFTKRTSGPEIVKDGWNGYTVNPDDIDELCTKMHTLMNNPSLRNEMAEAGYNSVVSRFKANRIVDQLEVFYTDCIDDASSTKN